jgi:hypothetical protein
MARRNGVEAVAVDPFYALPSPEIEQRCLEDVDLSLERIAQSDALRADFDLAAYRRSKLKALEEFLADRLAYPESYQTASLPNLPFGAGSFDLVVCGHLLFSYAPLADGGLFPTVEPLLTQLPPRWAGQLTTTAYDQGFEGATPLLLLERGGPDKT